MFSPLFKETASEKSAAASDGSSAPRPAPGLPAAPAPLRGCGPAPPPRSPLSLRGRGALPGQAAAREEEREEEREGARGAGGTSAGRRPARRRGGTAAFPPTIPASRSGRLTHLQPRGQPGIFLLLLAQVALRAAAASPRRARRRDSRLSKEGPAVLGPGQVTAASSVQIPQTARHFQEYTGSPGKAGAGRRHPLTSAGLR